LFGQLIGGSPAGKHEHARIVAMSFPRIQHVDARATLTSKSRQRALGCCVVVIERTQCPSVPSEPVFVPAALNCRLGRWQAEPPLSHVVLLEAAAR